MTPPRIILLTGARFSGKSTLCQRLAHAQPPGLTVSGLLTRHTGPHSLEVHELRSGLTYPLTLPFEGEGGIALTHFRMDTDAMARSARALEAAFPTDLFLLDEIGPLELERGGGWIAALRLLQTNAYRLAVVVVRPELLVTALAQLGHAVYTVAHVTPEQREPLFATIQELIQCPLSLPKGAP